MDYSHSEAKSHRKLSKLDVARDKVGGAELKVGGAAAPPTLDTGPPTSTKLVGRLLRCLLGESNMSQMSQTGIGRTGEAHNFSEFQHYVLGFGCYMELERSYFNKP